MSSHRRRLSAILHADVSGYVRLMASAEDFTVSHLKSARAEVWRPAVEAAGGRIVNILADSVLAEFDSAVAAVRAAIDIQDRMARFNEALGEDRRLMFRIGLHLGEVIVDETETIFGDAVNVAARIQLVAEPGGIAVSRAVRDATHAHIEHTFIDGGEHKAKNVGRSLHIFHLRPRERASHSLISATRTRSGAITIKRPALWGTMAAAMALLVGGGYMTLAPNSTITVGGAALTLSADQLEQALAERRRADVLAAEKRRLEEQARQTVEKESKAKRQAEMELENARQARQKAESELAQLKADIEARRQADDGKRDQTAVTAQRAAEEAAQRKAEAETASLREAEERAARKAAADAAAKRQADQALATATAQRTQAEANAIAAASRTAELPKVKEDAELLERSLRLEPADRQRVQIALRSLGFNARGDDGVFGPRSREMIARWQKAHSQPATGFLTGNQQQALLREAAPALSAYDEQRKLEEGVKVAAIAATPLPALDSAPPGSPDGLWRGTYECGRRGNFRPFTLKPEVNLQGGTGTWYTANSSPTNDYTISIIVSVDGDDVLVTRRSLAGGGGIAGGASANTTPLSGRLEGNSIRASNRTCTTVLTRDASAPPVVAGQRIAAASDGTRVSPSPDGFWQGTYECGRNGNFMPFTMRPEIHLRAGAGTWYTATPSLTNDNTIGIRVSVEDGKVRVTRQLVNVGVSNLSTVPLLGWFEGNSMQASNSACTMVLTRAVSPVHATRAVDRYGLAIPPSR